MAHSRAISLDDLIALNDEIVALVRAGVPLEGVLARLGEDLPGRLGRITQTLAERMRRGQSLADVLAGEPELFPPMYRAVVLAGLRGGRLAAALQSLSRSARRLAEARRMTATGFLYPILVVLVAWCLFAFFTARVSRFMYRFWADLGMDGGPLAGLFNRLGETAGYWGPVVPLAIIVLTAVWWFRSRRASMMQPGSATLLLGWVPLLGRLLYSYRMVTFTEVLSLLVENRVPLPESIVLSAESTGDPRMIRSAHEIADSLRSGRSLGPPDALRPGFPPLLDWLMVTGQRHSVLAPALSHAAEFYRRRARRQGDAARLFVPIVLTVAIGGTVTLAYALFVFAPWVRLLQALS